MKSKKTLVLIACIVVLVAAAVTGSLAFLIDEASVTNTFTVGKVDIKVDEADPENPGIRTEDGNEYHILPGQTYAKDPMLTVLAGSEESYIRMVMEISNHSAVQAIVDNHCGGDYAVLFGQNGYGSDWTYVDYEVDSAKNTISFEFRYNATVSTLDPKEDLALQPLFTELVVPDLVSRDELAALYGDETTVEDDFKITVYGHAIQTEGFIGDVDKAWESFENQYAYENQNP